MILAALGPFATYFIVFCRVGSCLMLIPGYASPHIQVHARLFLAIAISLSVTPLIEGLIGTSRNADSTMLVARLVAAECLAGALIGVLGRLVFSAVQIAGNLMTQLSGYSGFATIDDGSGDLAPELGALLSASVLTLLFVLDFHVDVIKALIESYLALPFGIIADPALALDRFAAAIAEAFRLAVQISAPFMLAGVTINFALGLVNKIAPQIPVTFLSAPFLLAAAFWILQRLGPELAAAMASGLMSLFATN